jgi:riboflavin biosynthesis pyrimidine reductase
MSTLAPLETLFEVDRGSALPLPCELEAIYGRLQFPPHSGRPYVISNFVSTIDGVVSLNEPGRAGGGPISGNSPHDRMVMGLLRAVADAVIVGAGTVRATLPRHLWTAGYIFPPLADAYQQLRIALGKPEPPPTVVVTSSGDIEPDRQVFQSGAAPILILTTAEGAQRLGGHGLPPSVQFAAVEAAGQLSARSILEAVGHIRPAEILLVEGGPHLLGDFFAKGCLDELFLTLAPQIAGRDDTVERPALVAGRVFAPEHPLWGALVSVKRAEDHLFLRYAFAEEHPASEAAGPSTAAKPGVDSSDVAR